MKIDGIAVRVIALSTLAASAVLAGLSENWHSLSAHVLAAWFAFVAIHTERRLAAAQDTILKPKTEEEAKRYDDIHD